jgi:hypothetical protein
MSDKRDQISQFLEQMRDQYEADIEAITLPDGTRDYIEFLISEGDSGTLLFMLKLGYLMGLQAGFAIASAGGPDPRGSGGEGPLQA